jgi:hypothetical protein
MRLPAFMSEVPPEEAALSFMVARFGPALDRCVLSAVNHKRFTCLLTDLSVDDNASVTFTGGNAHILYPEGFNQVYEDPSKVIFDQLRNIFGANDPITMYPLYPDGKTVSVSRHSVLWTPIKEQAQNPDKTFTLDELKKLSNFSAVQKLCILSAAMELDGAWYVPFDIATSDLQPIAYMDNRFPVVQLLNNASHAKLVFSEMPYLVDLEMTPIRAFHRAEEEKRRLIRTQSVQTIIVPKKVEAKQAVSLGNVTTSVPEAADEVQPSAIIPGSGIVTGFLGNGAK